MERKISFHNMDHSDPLEQHAHEKLNKIEELLKREQDASPMFVEMRLTSNKPHAHHRCEIHLKTPHINVNAHDEGPEMYVVLDSTIDKIVKLVKKEKSKQNDKNHKPDTEKSAFTDDKYTLSD